MNLHWLDDFLTLAASGNFSRAAEERHMTQPAFSRRVRALEEWLGVALFDRSNQPAVLTESGRWFLPVAQDLRDRLVRLPGDAQAVASSAALTLRFAATHALSLTFLPTWLRGLEARAPVGPVQLVSDVLAQCETLMLAGRAQFLLCHAHERVPSRLDPVAFPACVVGHDALVAACAPDEAGRPRHPLDDPAAAVLDYSPESGLGRLLRVLREDAGDADRSRSPVFTAHLATVLRSLALQGRGVAWLPQSLIDEDLRSGRLVAATRAVHGRLPVDIRLVRRAAPESPAAEAFWLAATGGAVEARGIPSP